MSVALVQWDTTEVKVGSVPDPLSPHLANNMNDSDRATIFAHATLGTVNGIVFSEPRLPAGTIDGLRIRAIWRHSTTSGPLRKNAHGLWWRESDLDPWTLIEGELEGIPTSGAPEEKYFVITPTTPANVQVLVGNWEQGPGDPIPTDP